MPIVVFIRFFQHREREDHCKGRSHRPRTFRGKWKRGHDRDDQEVNVRYASELPEQAFGRPCQQGVARGTDLIGRELTLSAVNFDLPEPFGEQRVHVIVVQPGQVVRTAFLVGCLIQVFVLTAR